MLDTLYARHDRAHCLAPGLFTSVRKGSRKSGFEVVYRFGDSEVIKFVGPYQLGAEDLRVLQGIVALSGLDGAVLSPQPSSDEGRQTRNLLNPLGLAVSQDAALVQTTYGKLAREIGYKSSDDTHSIKESIKRLLAVTIYVKRDADEAGFHLLSWFHSKGENAGLCIGINPRLAMAALGGGQFAFIDMDEVRRLSSAPARVLHQRLCGFFDHGRTYPLNLDTICSYIWHDESGSTLKAEARKGRRKTARKALKELEKLGWTVDEYSPLRFNITRPAHPPP